jgi:hypothetical protein
MHDAIKLSSSIGINEISMKATKRNTILGMMGESMLDQSCQNYE